MDNILNDEEIINAMSDELVNNDIQIPIEEPESTPMIPSIEEPIDIKNPDTNQIENTPNCTCSCCDIDSLTPGKFFGTLMESVQIIWRFHLKARKHSVHVILNECYEELLKKVDSTIEHYQGRFGIVDGYENCICDCDKTDVAYLADVRFFIENGRNKLFAAETEIISDTDDIIGIIDSTLYKLNNLTEHSFKSFEEFIYEDYAVCGVEGGVGGSFDTVTKSTNTNTAPSGAAKMGSVVSTKSNCSDKCEKNDGECEEEEEE